MNNAVKYISMTVGIVMFTLLIANSLICYWFGNYSTLTEVESKSNHRYEVSLYKWNAPRKSLKSYMKLMSIDKSDQQIENEIVTAYEFDSVHYEFLSADSLLVELYKNNKSLGCVISLDTLLIDLKIKNNIIIE